MLPSSRKIKKEADNKSLEDPYILTKGPSNTKASVVFDERF